MEKENEIFAGLKKLKTAIAAEEERLTRRKGKALSLPWVIFNKNLIGKNKPGPGIDVEKRQQKVDALASKLNYFEIIPKVADALIKNWFYGCKQGYLLTDDKIPIPTWFIFAGGTSPFKVTFEFITDLKNDRFINPRLAMQIKFTPKISVESTLFYKKAIPLDLVYSAIIEHFKYAYGEFAKKKGITIS